MQVIHFKVTGFDLSGQIEAWADQPSIKIQAPTMEELHHEARDALIERLGVSHVAYRIVINNGMEALSPRPAVARRYHKREPRES